MGGASSPGCQIRSVATRYHSLVIEPSSVPADLEVSAWAEDGTIMGVRHRSLAVEGVQFHPESILTEAGHRLLANWLAACGQPGRGHRSRLADPVARPPIPARSRLWCVFRAGCENGRGVPISTPNVIDAPSPNLGAFVVGRAPKGPMYHEGHPSLAPERV